MNKIKEETDVADFFDGAASGDGEEPLTSLILDGGQALLTEGVKPIGVTRNIKVRVEHFINDAQWDQTLRQHTKHSFHD